MTVYVTAIRTDPTGSQDHTKITEIRWLNSTDSKSNVMSVAWAVDWLLQQPHQMWVAGVDGAVEVKVVEGTRYLRTRADDTWQNNLLSLPRY